MEFDEVVKKRRSIRRYKGTPVPTESIVKVLEAARIAPSAGHRQPWHFVVVEDEGVRERLAGRSSWAAKAPVMIVGVADPVASPSWYMNDMGIAFEHIVLAATNLGLGTCWMGQIRRDAEVKEILGIHDEFRVIALTPLGEPDETPGSKERKSLEEIVSWDKFGGKAA
ncbi:MAG: nitroreductase family protein [Candidatus Bathyarchaeota archaeon]|nr:nitroreductase family protein [Candidatus Bathyarchaeota archaeon]